jgi:hypothetical protein
MSRSAGIDCGVGMGRMWFRLRRAVERRGAVPRDVCLRQRHCRMCPAGPAHQSCDAIVRTGAVQLSDPGRGHTGCRTGPRAEALRGPEAGTASWRHRLPRPIRRRLEGGLGGCTSRGELPYDCRVFVLAPGERARAPVGWGGWDGPPASGKVLVTWAGGQTQVTADGPVQPEADGPATNLWSSWFEQWARCQSCGTTLNGSTPSAASEPPEQSSAYRAIAA